METNKAFYTIQEFAEGCGYTRQRMYQLLKGSVIKAVKHGHSWFIPKREFNKWRSLAVKRGEIKKYNFFPRQTS